MTGRTTGSREYSLPKPSLHVGRGVEQPVCAVGCEIHSGSHIALADLSAPRIEHNLRSAHVNVEYAL
jgi:hypothetical protein